MRGERLRLQGTLTAHAGVCRKTMARGITGNGREEANESIDILLAERRLACRDRGGHGCDAAGALPAYVERVDRTRQTCRRPRLRFGELYRTSLPHRGVRAFQQSRAARPLRRDADEAHPRRSAWY